jgi:hypothetical protein
VWCRYGAIAVTQRLDPSAVFRKLDKPEPYRRWEKPVWLALAAALVVVASWSFYDSTYSKSAFASRQNQVEQACLNAHPVTKGSTDADFAAADACFKLPAPPPSAGLLVERGCSTLGTALLVLLLAFRLR